MELLSVNCVTQVELVFYVQPHELQRHPKSRCEEHWWSRKKLSLSIVGMWMGRGSTWMPLRPPWSISLLKTTQGDETFESGHCSCTVCPGGPQRERKREIRKVRGNWPVTAWLTRQQATTNYGIGQRAKSGSERGQSSGHAQCQRWEFIECSITEQSSLIRLQQS